MHCIVNRWARGSAALILLLSAGCFPVSAPFHLYPINSPSSAAPVQCRLRIHFGWQTMTISAVMPTGGVFTGSFSTRIGAPNQDLAPEWDRVFGAGFFNAKVLGSLKHFRTTLKNEAGEALLLEMHAIPGDVQGGMEGIAIDANKGIYKAGY